MKSAPDRRQGVVYTASRLVVDAGTTFAPGALAVADGNVLLAGPKADVLRAAPAVFPRMEFPGAAIVPGLVNAHAHLQIPRFTDEAGIPLPIPLSFVDWILRVIAWRLGAAPASFAENFRSAAAEALSFGTTTVGEIAGPDLPSYDGCPLRARVFAEGIGFAPHVASEVLALVGAAIDRLEKISVENPLVQVGVSPHTLYTVGERLLRSLADLAAAKGLPACLHLSESTAEMAFLSDGGGEIASRLYPAVGKDVSWFRGLGRTIPAYLAEAGLLREGVLLVHNVHLPRPEIDALRAGGARFVLCPRSNAAHGNGAPDVTHFVDAEIPFALGTDSLGSVPDLSLWSETADGAIPVQGTEEGRGTVPGTVPGRHRAWGCRPRSPRRDPRPGRAGRLYDRGRPWRGRRPILQGTVGKDGPGKRAVDRRRRAVGARRRRVKKGSAEGMAGRTEKPDSPSVKVVSTNRRARHEYEILETFECGLALQGHEVKSIREGRVNIADGFAAFRGNEAFVENMHITPYSHGDVRVIDPLRVRKLLLKRKEIDYLFGKVKERGLSVIPLKLYFKGPRVKLEVGLGRGKKLYDKRHDIAERDARRDIERATRTRGKRSVDRE